MTRNRRRAGRVETGMGSWVALGALALTLTATGCGAPSAAPQPSAPQPSAPQPSAGTSTEATAPPSASASSPVPTASTSAATLIAFVMVSAAGTGGATEVSGPDQLDRLAGGPPEALDPARAAVARNTGADKRLFAFVLSGCRNTGATLAIQARRITATLTGGEGTACFAAEWYLAVFAVPATQIQPGTHVG